MSRHVNKRRSHSPLPKPIKLDDHYHFLVMPRFKRDQGRCVLIEYWQVHDKISAEKHLGLHPKEFSLLCQSQTQSNIHKLFNERLRILTYQYIFHFLLQKYPKFRSDTNQAQRLRAAAKRFPKDIKQHLSSSKMDFPMTLFSKRYPLPVTQKLLPPKRRMMNYSATGYSAPASQVVRVRHGQQRTTRAKRMVY